MLGTTFGSNLHADGALASCHLAKQIILGSSSKTVNFDADIKIVIEITVCEIWSYLFWNVMNKNKKKINYFGYHLCTLPLLKCSICTNSFLISKG